MDILDKAHIADTFQARHGWRFAWLDRKWWILDEGRWTQFMAKERLIRTIGELGRELFQNDPKNRQQAGMGYVQASIASLLCGRLMVSGLPGRRQEADDDSPTS